MNSILYLQRTIGNQAVQRMLQNDAQESEAALTGPPSPRFGNSYEQEADRLAEQVMRTSGQEPEDSLRTKRVYASEAEQIAAPPSVHEVLRSPGHPLDSATSAFMEQRFGHDFSRVRLHDDEAAAQSARDVGANAYTVGHDIVFGGGQFGGGQFAPGTHEGKRLLAHELIHVTQQSGGLAGVQRTPETEKRESRSEVTARQRGRVMAARIKKEGKLSEKSKAQMVRDLRFFEGTGWDTYVETVRPTLQAVTEIDMSETSAPVLAELASQFSQTFLPAVQGAREILIGGGYEEPEGLEVVEARKAFRAQHKGHGQQVLDHIDLSLKRVTNNNPALLVAYYRYYAKHQLSDKLPGNMSEETHTGATAGGDSDINPLVLNYESGFPTESHISLLGETLIHEYSHTPQDNPLNPLFEAKAYGIEWFFAERSGDQAREDFIDKWYSRAPRDEKELLYFSYYTMRELYKVIDKGGPEAEKARDMSVEYISKNASDYRPELRAIFLDVSQFYVP